MSKVFTYSAIVLAAIVLTLAQDTVLAQGPPGRGPAKVVVERGREGIIAPQSDFRGSVYFKELSNVASEARGKVTTVMFEEGQRVRKGELLVKLDDELLRKDLSAINAQLERDRVELENAQVRFTRAESLVEDGLTTSEQVDEYRFDVKSLQYQLVARQAEVERINTAIKKSATYAPFDGIVIERQTQLGEWKSDGDTVAVIAREHAYEIVVDVPEAYITWVRPNQEVELQIGTHTLTGKITSIIPRGDFTTRTFPVKVRIDSDLQLYEGMTAIARLPIGERIDCIIVPRDALIHRDGADILFTVTDGVAHQHFADIIGYDGLFAGVSAPNIVPGDRFITKGHERLRGGAPVEVLDAPVAPSSIRDSDD